MANLLLFGNILRRGRTFRERTNHLQVDHFNDIDLRSRYRFGTEAIRFITDLVKDDVENMTNRNHAISTELQVLTALRYFATGDFMETIGDSVGISKSTVSRIIDKVANSLASKVQQFVSWPDNDEAPEIKRGFMDKGGFPGVIGCIDGSHVRIQAPTENEPVYVNRKGFHSINMQAVCNHKGKLRNLVARWPGSTHDSHVFRTSQLCNFLEQQHHGYLLGDSGYACKPYLLTPFLNPQQPHRERYNVYHRRTRVAIERTFGRLKRRFHCLHSELRVSPEKACIIIAACVVLHNIAILLNEPMEEDDHNNDNDDDDEDGENGIHGLQNQRQEGRLIREHIATTFFRA